MTTTEPPDGVLPVDKPRGPTSHDVVAIARRALRTRRIGHTGTLDPFASGLLLLCVGNATRIAEYITGMDKRYRATVKLGVSTETDDDTGAVIESRDASDVTRSAIEHALASLRGVILQVPPRYSAKKVDGERAYRVARAGGDIELKPVTVTIHELEIVRQDADVLELDVHCSSGTYIRAIARDLGTLLGTGAHLTALQRTAIGEHRLEDALSLDTLVEDPEQTAGALIDPLAALGGMQRVDIDEIALEHVKHGRAVRSDSGAVGTVALASGGALVAIAHAEDGVIRPRKVFV